MGMCNYLLISALVSISPLLCKSAVSLTLHSAKTHTLVLERAWAVLSRLLLPCELLRHMLDALRQGHNYSPLCPNSKRKCGCRRGLKLLWSCLMCVCTRAAAACATFVFHLFPLLLYSACRWPWVVVNLTSRWSRLAVSNSGFQEVSFAYNSMSTGLWWG